MDWLKNLPPQDFIYLIGGLFLGVLVILILIKVLKISREIAGRSLKMTEEIISTDQGIVTNIKVINRSYIDNEITEVGMIYKKKKVIIIEEVIKVAARDKYEIVASHDEIRSLLKISDFHIGRLKFYFENSVGNIVKSRAKLTKREITKALKKEKKQFAQDKKEQRYQDGTYTAGDRFVLFFQNLFSPIKKARHKSVIKRNKKIADKRAEKEVELEREKLIEAQKLIYEQQLRETRKEELRKEYQIDELKSTLEELEKNETINPDLITVEEIVGLEKNKKNKKDRKKEKNEQEEIEKILIDEEDENIDEEKNIEELDSSNEEQS